MFADTKPGLVRRDVVSRCITGVGERQRDRPFSHVVATRSDRDRPGSPAEQAGEPSWVRGREISACLGLADEHDPL